MICKEYLKTLEYDDLDPESITNTLKIILDKKDFGPEQILFCIGRVLDKNKESYIRFLKNMKSELKMENDQLKSKNKKLEDKIKEFEEKEVKSKNIHVNTASPKKKIVVLKRKSNG